MPILTRDEKDLIGTARQQEQERQDERYIAADLNAALDEGSFFTISNAATNKPYDSHSGILKILKDNDTSTITQTFHGIYGKTWIRISGPGDGSDWVDDDDWVETYDSARVTELENTPAPAPTPPHEPEAVKVPISGKKLTIAECILGYKDTINPDWIKNKDFYIEDTTGAHQVFSVMYIADGAVSEVDHGRFVYEKMRYAH